MSGNPIRKVAQRFALLAVATALHGQTASVQTDRPSGLVLGGDGAFITQPVVRTVLPAEPGVLLYEGDTVETHGQPLRVALCPSTWTIRRASRVSIGAGKLNVLAGGADPGPALSACELPKALRFPLAETAAPGAEADGAPGSRPGRIAALTAAARSELEGKLRPVETAIAADPHDVAARIARANLFERYHLAADARYEFEAIGRDFPGAEWTRGVKVRLDSEIAKKERGPGKTFALLIGISAYRADTGIAPLRYAARDAVTFRDFLKSKRGGELPDSQIDLLTDGDATREKIELALNGFVRDSRGEDNTLIVMIAAHGANVPSTKSAAGAEPPQPYVLTFEGNTQDLGTAGIPMSKLRQALVGQITSFRQVLVYLDVCRAGSLWPVEAEPKAVSQETSRELQTSEGNLGLLLATSPNEKEPNTLAYESAWLDHGHGAFTYYVLSSLNGGLKPDEQGLVIFDDLANEVSKKVRVATNQRQRPFGQSSKPNLVVLDHPRPEGIEIAAPEKLPILAEQTRGIKGPGASPARSSGDAPEDAVRAAIRAGHLLPADGGGENARDLLAAMLATHTISGAEWRAMREQLRVALEEKGQDVILEYLRGAQPPLGREDFLRGRDYFRAALEILPGSPYDESRMDFAEGRALLFEYRYDQAVQLLEQSIRIDPTRAYAYNALGVAFLQLMRRDPDSGVRAEAAFADAIHFAPYWAYPRHNLALLYAARGEYDRAFEALREAERRAPLYSYLPYTVGLLHQQLNLTDEARQDYQSARDVAQRMRDLGQDSRRPGRWPEVAEIENALGSLADNENRRSIAERFYRQSMATDPGTIGARLNLAALLTERGKESREAEALWRQAIQEDSYGLAGRVALADYLSEHGRAAEALPEYEQAVAFDPQSRLPRLGLMRALLAAGRPADAIAAVPLGPDAEDDFEVAELLGDANHAMHRSDQARVAWEKALALWERVGDPRLRSEARQRLQAKIRNAERF